MSKFAACLITILFLLAGTRAAKADGAIAVNPNNPSQFGSSINEPSQSEADSVALRRCGNSCVIVIDFSNTCGALAVDNTTGSTLYATAYGGGPDNAGQIAINSCAAQGGGACYRRTFACDGARYHQSSLASPHSSASRGYFNLN